MTERLRVPPLSDLSKRSRPASRAVLASPADAEGVLWSSGCSGPSKPVVTIARLRSAARSRRRCSRSCCCMRTSSSRAIASSTRSGAIGLLAARSTASTSRYRGCARCWRRTRSSSREAVAMSSRSTPSRSTHVGSSACSRKAEGRTQQAGRRRALTVLKEALALWRGEALGNLAYEDFARAESQPARGASAQCDRGANRRGACARRTRRPYRGAGRAYGRAPPSRAVARTADARSLPRGSAGGSTPCYGDIRRRLGEELGVEPGHGLKELEHAILRQDPALGHERRPVETRRRLSP